jgi:hypothetical protein
VRSKGKKMVRHAFCISDSRSGVHNAPFVYITQKEAEAAFYRLVNDPLKQSPMAQHPEDFDLWYLGEFDDTTGKFTALDTPKHLTKASTIANR